jgi:hypothetical protein
MAYGNNIVPECLTVYQNRDRMEVLIAQIKEQWTFWSLSRGGGEKE